MNNLVRRFRKIKHSDLARRHAYSTGDLWDLDAFAAKAGWAAVAMCSVVVDDMTNVLKVTNLAVVGRDMQERFPRRSRWSRSATTTTEST